MRVVESLRDVQEPHPGRPLLHHGIMDKRWSCMFRLMKPSAYGYCTESKTCGWWAFWTMMMYSMIRVPHAYRPFCFAWWSCVLTLRGKPLMPAFIIIVGMKKYVIAWETPHEGLYDYIGSVAGATILISTVWWDSSQRTAGMIGCPLSNKDRMNADSCSPWWHARSVSEVGGVRFIVV